MVPLKWVFALLETRFLSGPLHRFLGQRIHPPSLSKAIVQVARWIPHANCLTQAVALFFLCKSSGFSAELCLGVARDPDGKFRSHAWVGDLTQVFIGEEELRRYQVIYRLRSEPLVALATGPTYFLDEAARLIIWSACLYTAGRCLFPVHITRDIGVQMQAAFRIVEGSGLTTLALGSPPLDICQAATPIPLGHWPPGYSLLLAAFFRMGLSSGLATKIICGFCTLLGWQGWASLLTLPQFAMRRPSGLFSWWIKMGLVVTVFSITPSWRGTDILLWAATPYLVIWLYGVLMAENDCPKVCFSIGCLVGVEYTFRFAALFLLSSTLLTLLLSLTQSNFWQRARQAIWVLLGFVLFWMPVYCFVMQPQSHPYLDSARFHIHNIPKNLDLLWQNVSFLALPLWQWLGPHEWTRFLQEYWARAINIPVILLLGLAPFILALFPAPQRMRGKWCWSLSLASLVCCNLLMLALSTLLMGEVGFVREYRYFIAIQIPIYYLLVSGCIGLRRWLRIRSIVLHLPRVLVFRVFILVLVLSLGFGVRWYWSPTILWLRNGLQERAAVSGMVNGLEQTQEFLCGLRESDPQAIIFLEGYEELMYRNPDLQGRFRPIPDIDWWHSAYSSRPVKVYLQIKDIKDAQGYYEVSASASKQVIEGLASRLSFEVVQEFPGENSVIVSCLVPAGTKIYPTE